MLWEILLTGFLKENKLHLEVLKAWDSGRGPSHVTLPVFISNLLRKGIYQQHQSETTPEFI